MIRSGKYLVFVAAFLTGMTLLGQQTLLEGVILDARTKEPIIGVAVFVQGKGVASDGNGRFEITYDRTERAEVKLSHITYLNRTIRGPFKEGQFLKIRLEADVAKLKAVEIFAEPKPEIVYESRTLHVAEYEVSDAGIWMLNYIKPRMFRREAEVSKDIYDEVELVLLDTNMQVIDSEQLPNGMLGMEKDHEGEIILRGKNGDIHAQYFHDHIILQELPEGLADERLSWTDSIHGKLLGSNFIEQYPAFDHFHYDRDKDESILLYSVEDEPLMELFRSEIKYMSGRDRVIARDLEFATGIDKEIHAAYMSGFPNSLYYRPLYAPLFVLNDTIFVFDHYKNYIKRFRWDLLEAGTAPIDYHLGKKGRSWEKEILHDKPDSKLYAMFARNTRTWLERVNTSNGELEGRMELYYRFPEDVRVFDGYVYYVYREFGSLQKKTLYREPINLDLPAQDSVSDSQTK